MTLYFTAYACHHWAGFEDIDWKTPFTTKEAAKCYASSMLCDDDSETVFRADINLEANTVKVTDIYHDWSKTLRVSDIPELQHQITKTNFRHDKEHHDNVHERHSRKWEYR